MTGTFRVESMNLFQSWMLPGKDGPTGGFALVTAHAKGIYYGVKGEGAKAAGAGAGLWGSLSGGVIGFCLGGPWGAFVGSPVGGAVAAYATEAIVNAFTPKHEAQIQTKFEETCSMGINKKYLHHFRRQPALWEEIDHMYFTIKDVRGDQDMFWVYEGREIPVFVKPDHPNHLFVYHSVGNSQCESSFQLTYEGNVKERNITHDSNWDWIRED